MELEEQYRVDTNNLLERLNEQLSSEVKYLREELYKEKKLNILLLKKIGIREQVEQVSQEFKPIGGYTPLRDKIKEAEQKSRKILEDANETDNA